jgi:hypothetical protein
MPGGMVARANVADVGHRHSAAVAGRPFSEISLDCLRQAADATLLYRQRRVVLEA